LNSEIIVAGIGLCLVAVYFLFRTQILIMLNRLASFEFRAVGNRQVNSETNVQDTKPWPWYKAWLNSFLHPNEDTWNRLLSEQNISFVKAYSWVVFSSLLFPLVYSVVAWVKFSSSMSIYIPDHVRNIVLIGIFEPIGFIAITGAIHLLAKLFGKGNYQSFFVVFATSLVPISILYTLAALFRWVFTSKTWLYAGVLLNFYFMIFVSTGIISFNYRVNRLVALLISIVVTALSSFVAYRIYCLTGFGI
jgi:hypothetical protein